MDNFRDSKELTQTAILTASGCVHEGEVSLNDLKRSLLDISDRRKSSATGVRDGGSSDLSDDEIEVSQSSSRNLPHIETPEERETLGVDMECFRRGGAFYLQTSSGGWVRTEA